ncbi:uncharacterized protein LOC134265645 [Saccostrea cucullata]|uniref:uncharacterized protein LOC134265645 n=1 Tax=Saccostrea cuccullata TaxID=36930 RepID=UPI002ECFFDD5
MATGGIASTESNGSDFSDGENERSAQNFDMGFAFQSQSESGSAEMSVDIKYENIDFADDSDLEEALLSCLTQTDDSGSTGTEQGRFPNLTETDLTNIEENKDSLGTIKQTKWAVSLFREWLSENGQDEKFENLSATSLDETLRRFYASLRTAQGDLYSKSTFVGIRASINRHLRAPPYCQKISLLDSNDFVKSNNMFKSMLKKIKKDGFDKTKHYEAISEADLQKLRSTDILSCRDPKSLQRKVWFDITLSFARRGRENIRDLKCSAFIFKTDDAGKEYVQMAYNEATKNHPGDRIKDNDHETQPRMYATSSSQCPVTSLRLYLDKRNKTNEILFQQAKRTFNPNDDEWYTSRPLGEKTLNNMMKSISADAGLSKSYTNHCVRATTITLLSHAGVEAREIMRISGHRNEQSIKSYNTDSSEDHKRLYSSILHGASMKRDALSPLNLPVQQQISSATSLATSSSTTVHAVGLSQNNTLNIQQNIPMHYQKQFDIYNSSVQVYNFFGPQ